jgi:hypothetical protein
VRRLGCAESVFSEALGCGERSALIDMLMMNEALIIGIQPVVVG